MVPEVKDTQLNIYSATEVQHWIEGHKRSGEFRRCSRLKTITRKVGTGRISVQVHFIPWCERLSFKWSVEAYGNVEMQREILANYLGRREGLVQCPANCAFYENVLWALGKQRIAGLWKLRRYLAVPFRWFHSLAWQVQLALIVLAVVALSSKWVPPIVTLLKAFHGQ
jgi:hypothetical protein